MTEVMQTSIKEQLWHKMRSDLAVYVPEVADNDQLMCCACGRFLPQEFFDLEHIVPQQALKADPIDVRSNPLTPANLRAGNVLLCRKPLVHKGAKAYNNGCNSWKGRFFDRPISEIFSERAQQGGKVTNAHIIGGLVLGYLAMVAEFGYIVALMRSGLLVREQFFMPRRFHPALGTRHHILLAGVMPSSPDEKVWTKPFSFKVEEGACVVAARNFSVLVPLSRDPRAPIARHLQFAPAKYKFRPDFRTVFD